jgi:hypothetical protein
MSIKQKIIMFDIMYYDDYKDDDPCHVSTCRPHAKYASVVSHAGMSCGNLQIT